MDQRWAGMGGCFSMAIAIVIAIGNSLACGSLATPTRRPEAGAQDGVAADTGRDDLGGNGGSGGVDTGGVAIGPADGGGGGSPLDGSFGEATTNPDGNGGAGGVSGTGGTIPMATGGSSSSGGTDGGGLVIDASPGETGTGAGGITGTGGTRPIATGGGSSPGGTGGVPGNGCSSSTGGSTPITQTPMLASAGATCAAPGLLACAGVNQQQVLICSNGVWTVRLTCDVNQRCDSTSGRCADIVSGCTSQEPGYAFCDANTLKVCGLDLVTVASIACCGRCDAGVCETPRCGDGLVQAPEECDDGNTTPADGCENDCKRTVIVQLAAGWTHSCALFASGGVRCWGGNDRGQLGLGTNEDLSAKHPFELGPIGLGAPATSLAAGYRHTCALMAGGSVQCWGRNDFGQLGLGHANDIGDDEVPTAAVSKVPLGATAKLIAAGGDSTCTLLADNSLRCWGRNDFGQLGLGHTDNIGDDELPTAANAQVSLGGTPTALALAGDHDCALLDTNGIRCWGRNDLGQLGIGSTSNIGDNELPSTTTPITFIEKGPIVGLTAGGDHTCVQIDSTAFGSLSSCWGYNGDGSLGVASFDEKPLALAGDWPPGSWGFPIVRLVCGAKHTCLLLSSHDLRCFGLNDYAQLGLPRLGPLGTNAPPNNAAPIDFGLDSKGIPAYATLFATGSYHNCALLNTGEVRCWGMNLDGQLGLAFTSPAPTGYLGGAPDTVPGKLPAVEILPP